MANPEGQQIDFFDSGYNYASGQDGTAAQGGYGVYPADQSGNYGEYYGGGFDQSYNAAPGYGGQGPSIMNAQQNNYGYDNQMKQGSVDYASFEDEPPLLEGIIGLLNAIYNVASHR